MTVLLTKFICMKDLSEPKYQFLNKKREDAGIKNLNDPSALTQTLGMMFATILMITNQKEKEKR